MQFPLGMFRWCSINEKLPGRFKIRSGRWILDQQRWINPSIWEPLVLGHPTVFQRAGAFCRMSSRRRLTCTGAYLFFQLGSKVGLARREVETRTLRLHKMCCFYHLFDHLWVFSLILPPKSKQDKPWIRGWLTSLGLFRGCSLYFIIRLSYTSPKNMWIYSNTYLRVQFSPWIFCEDGIVIQ